MNTDIISYTIKSTSDEGIYYLVNGWNTHKKFWEEPKKMKKSMFFQRPADAKRSLSKLLKVMDEYRTDTMELVSVDLSHKETVIERVVS